MPDASNYLQQSEFAAAWQDKQEQGVKGPFRDSRITPREAFEIAPEHDLLFEYCPCMEFHNEGYCVCGENP